MNYINAAILAFVYRLRGGGYVTLNHTLVVRAAWALALGVAFVDQTAFNLWSTLYVLLAGFGMMYVPHAYCQNMGQWPMPQKGWPSFFFPTWTQLGWSTAPVWQRAAYDAGQMACIGLLRGLILFGPLVFIGDGISMTEALTASMTIAILQPVAYLLGRYVMLFSIIGCMKRSPEWGEFLNGAAWAIAMAVT